ncbi:MAG: deoxyribodipyrimidine photo-lyase [candidate division FCPU426 bacterium]
MPDKTPSSGTTLVWFRRDLRLDDQPALRAAAETGAPVIPVFIWPLAERAGWTAGAAGQWWLHHSLLSLQAGLRQRGSRLVLRQGEPLPALLALGRKTGARRVHWTRSPDPLAAQAEAETAAALRARGWRVEIFPPHVLFPAETIRTAFGNPVRVFSAYWKQCLAQPFPSSPLPAPGKWRSPSRWPASDRLEKFELLPRPDWAGGLRQAWEPGEAAALRALRRFLRAGLEGYGQARDWPGVDGTSRLSPHLAWGELSVRRAWEAVHSRPKSRGAAAFLRQLGWREFAHYLLWHFPQTPEQPLRESFVSFPWVSQPGHLRAWQQGLTGYPFVDAGQRELRATGWMHNRARMVAASFLTKHLLIPWQAGARWFWEELVDADLANNTLGWQWVAGCGADAAPYFRVFNPSRQGERFDPLGAYVRRWVPELKRLPDRWLHRPWEAPARVLSDAKVRLGREYPLPLIPHAAGRARALAAYQRLRSRKRGGHA